MQNALTIISYCFYKLLICLLHSKTFASGKLKKEFRSLTARFIIPFLSLKDLK